MRTTITLSIDSDIKSQSMWIIQNKLNMSFSSYVEEKLKELILSSKSQIGGK